MDNSYDLPFKFTGSIDKLTIKVGESQMTEEQKQTSAETIQKASD